MKRLTTAAVIALAGAAAPCLATGDTTTTGMDTRLSWVGWFGEPGDRRAAPGDGHIAYRGGALAGYGMAFALYLPDGELCSLIDGQSSFILPGEPQAGLTIQSSGTAYLTTSGACGSGVIRRLPTFGAPNGIRFEYDSKNMRTVLPNSTVRSGDTHAAGAVGFGAGYENTSKETYVYYTAAFGETTWTRSPYAICANVRLVTGAVINNNPNTTITAEVDSEPLIPGDQVLLSCGAGPECFGPEYTYDIDGDGNIDVRIRPSSLPGAASGSVTESGTYNGTPWSYTYFEGTDYFCVDDVECMWLNGGAQYTSGVNSSRFQALQISLSLSTSGGASSSTTAIVALTDDGSITSASDDPAFSIATRGGVDNMVSEYSHGGSITLGPGETVDIDQSVVQIDSYAYDLNDDGVLDGRDLDLMVLAIMVPGTLDITDLTLDDASDFRDFLTSPLLTQLDLDGAFLNGPEVLGDYDRNGVLEMADYNAMLLAYRSVPANTTQNVLGILSSSADYNALGDLDLDGVIRLDDLTELRALVIALP